MNEFISTTKSGQLQPVTHDAMCAWLAFIDVSPDTARTYAASLRQLARYLHARGIKHPTREDLRAYRDELRTRCAPATIQIYITAARLFFKWTAESGIYPNIADHLKGAKISPGHKRDYLTSEQLRAVFAGVDTKSARGCRDLALLALMACGGLRDIEIHRANIGDIQPAGGSAALWIQGKGRDDKADFVKIPQAVERVLLAYLRTRGSPPPTAPLFVSYSNGHRGERLSRRSISGIVRGYIRAAGLTSSKLTAHSLRHSAVTLALLGGASLQEVQQFARHKAISTTQIYAHNLAREENPCEGLIAAQIFEGKGQA